MITDVRCSGGLYVEATSLPDVLTIEPQVFHDDRGFFLESYNSRRMAKIGITAEFVQDNHSFSVRGVLRGLHYQLKRPQGKLIRPVVGEIFDVAVDLRARSATFGRSVSVRLSSRDHRMLWIPPGFAHGFLVLSEVAEVLYKTTTFYDPKYERTLLWDDPDLSISWPNVGPVLLSEKDSRGLRLKDVELDEAE